MKFLLRVKSDCPPQIVSFAEDKKTEFDMILDLTHTDNILSVVDNLDLLEIQDGFHLLKVNEIEYRKINIFTNLGYIYNSKDYEILESFHIVDYSPVKSQKDTMERLITEINLTKKKTQPITIDYANSKKKKNKKH